MLRLAFRLVFVALLPGSMLAQSAYPSMYDSVASRIVTNALQSGRAYPLLYELTTKIGHRLSGSPEAARAVAWSKKKMEELGFDNVHLEPLMVPHWIRGKGEKASLTTKSSKKPVKLNITALGGSIATPAKGITAEVLEVKTFEELHALGAKAKGKIIFFNRPMDRTKVRTFEAYGGAVLQRWAGAVEAAKVGGVAALVRSMTTRLDDTPHTGSMGYVDSVRKVPTAAVSTKDAERLSALLKSDPKLKLSLTLSCKTLPDVQSANVIGELKGSEKPNEVVVVGGHLDSWDKGQGAHDDGTGTMQSIEVLRLIKETGLKPKRTIRAVMFMNEENGLRGGTAYANADRPGERNIAAIESDAGGFTPRGFGVVDSAAAIRIMQWAPLFRSIGADQIHWGEGGADISPMEKKGVVCISLNVDSQRYFDYHHSDNDTIDKVNERELELGAAAMAILAYVIAQEGI